MNSRELWKANLDLANACLEHPFVQGIATGNLARERFQHYVAQDAFFLEAFARAYALAAAKSPDRAGLVQFKDLMVGVFDELELHASYAARWDIDLAPEPTPATRAYTDFLLATAGLEPAGHIAAAMTPCMRLYGWLGQSLAPTANPESPYHEWVVTYAGDGLETMVRGLEALMDRYSGDSTSIARLYRTAMQLELDFFEAAYQGA